jgi:hypothetical protein
MDEGTLEQINSHINLPITEKDSENSVNLSFSIAVKSLPRQLTIVIGR